MVDSIPFTIPGVKGVQVLNDHLILLHALNTAINYEDAKEGWFIIIPKENTVRGFYNYKSYYNYLDSIGLKQAPRLSGPAMIYSYFKRHKVIDWKAFRNKI